jgi:hypothetical protein
VRTLRRRLREVPDEEVSDESLDAFILQIKRTFHAPGLQVIWGALRAAGLTVTRRRLEDAINRADPEGRAIRIMRRIPRRRRYWVPHPNAVWHMDGHHKLIHYGFVIHGAIDGYSRRIIWLKVCPYKKT